MRLVSTTLNESIEYFKIYNIANNDLLYENILLESINEEFNVEKIRNIVNKIKNKKILLNNLIKKFNETTNSKLKKYIASILAVILLSNFVIKNNQWAEVSHYTIDNIKSKILKNEKLSFPELTKITNIKPLSILKNNITYKIVEMAIDIATVKTSEEAKNSIKESEKLKLMPYIINYTIKDKKGKLIKKNDGMITVGYGHAEPIRTSKYKLGEIITLNEANKLFALDIKKAENGIKRMFKEWKAEGKDIKITQNMFNAMVSMSYNMGISRFRQTEFIKHLKDNNHIMAAKNIKLSGISKKYPGLIIRRQKEYDLFAKDLSSK